MSNETNMVCSICGKRYYLCKTCEENKGIYSPWRLFTDTIDCYKIFTICGEYSTGLVTIEEAREVLGKINLSEIESFDETAKNLIKEILKDRKEGTEVIEEQKNETPQTQPRQKFKR